MAGVVLSQSSLVIESNIPSKTSPGNYFRASVASSLLIASISPLSPLDGADFFSSPSLKDLHTFFLN